MRCPDCGAKLTELKHVTLSPWGYQVFRCTGHQGFWVYEPDDPPDIVTHYTPIELSTLIVALGKRGSHHHEA